ncbi:MAG: DUF3127 domain-containing protein [Bacteroidia bacterium]|nr:DUF3127 domain-containing protein [Bacteroidia bacterium]MCZ2247246.1 DUF3127 domain-containing protein [Bacteroidia bacterium]
MFEISGILKVKNSEVQVSEKFRKREFVIQENSSQFPQILLFQLTQDRCSLIENANIGDEIKVNFNLRGREWTNQQGEVKYFNSLEAFRVDIVRSVVNSNNASQMSQSTDFTAEANKSVETAAAPGSNEASGADDDLPF